MGRGISIAKSRAVATLLAVGGLVAALTGAGQAAVNVADSGWSWASPTPQGRDLHAIAFSGGTGFAVGDGGAALATADAGHTWSGLNTGTGSDLEQVQAISPTALLVIGGSGCVTRISGNGGQTFKRIFNVAESGCPEPVAAASFLSAQSGFLLLGNGSLEATGDGGETFAKRTAVPGTPAASGGGGSAGAAVHFTTSTAGIAFVTSGAGQSSAFSTPDGGVSWTPVALPAGSHVTALHFVDASNAYAVGPGTFLRSTDGGVTWKQQAIAAGNSFTSIDCDSATECVMTVSSNNELVITRDGGVTASVRSLSNAATFAAAYAGSAKIVAVGAGGSTVLSGDGGNTFTTVSAALGGGGYSRLRAQPGGLIAAIGERGDLALSGDGGATWRLIATQTSAALRDVAFAGPQVAYALDVHGGLQQTTNGGASWQTLSTAGGQPQAVAALGNAVLLIGPKGIQRAAAGGRFQPLGGSVSRASVNDYVLAGSVIFAYGRGTGSLLRSTSAGASWRALRLPLTNRRGRSRERLRSVSFTSATQGFVIDTAGRVWVTRNAGASWRELPATGNGGASDIAFSDPTHGFLGGLSASFGGTQQAYVLRTGDGGATWHPQEVSVGSESAGGLAALSATSAVLLLRAEAEPASRLFFTTGGGDVTGTPSTLTLSTVRTRISRRQLRAAHRTITVSGTLAGAVGGEQIVIGRRSLGGGAWEDHDVVAGANGGTFSTTFHITGSSVFVAQWAGDSGRPGLGSRTLTVTVR